MFSGQGVLGDLYCAIIGCVRAHTLLFQAGRLDHSLAKLWHETGIVKKAK